MANTCVEVTVTYRIDTDDDLPEDFEPDELADIFADELPSHLDVDFEHEDGTTTVWAADRGYGLEARFVS
jgi:hypothetical protein